jgi:tRNA pseudouridine32 synthase / 23S rRNA pseudouridine746 synthase
LRRRVSGEGSPDPARPRATVTVAAPPILFRDDRFVVLDKPPGLPVHPGPRGGPSVEDFFPALSRRTDGPWLAHRLDADTAGCLVIALRRAALIAAQAEFAAGRAKKTYWAVVRGVPHETAGIIDTPLRRHGSRSGWRMVGDAAGQTAVTDWRLRGQAGDVAWLELHPRTGRTHQVRVHCAMLGCPVLGDPIYGEGKSRLHLLARAIALSLDPPLAATAPPPPHMRGALARCGWLE